MVPNLALFLGTMLEGKDMGLIDGVGELIPLKGEAGCGISKFVMLNSNTNQIAKVLKSAVLL